MEVVVNVVSVKVTKHGAAQSVFAGRTSINPLTEETQTVRVLPVAVNSTSRMILCRSYVGPTEETEIWGSYDDYMTVMSGSDAF